MNTMFIHLINALLILATAVRCNENKNLNFLDNKELVAESPIDLDTIKYLLLSKLAKYHALNNNNNEWKPMNSASDPAQLLNMLNEMEYNNIDENGIQGKPENFYIKKRPSSSSSSRIGDSNGSLSIVNSLDVLRNRLLLEIARKKVKEGADRNRILFNSIGKRGSMMKNFWQSVDAS